MRPPLGLEQKRQLTNKKGCATIKALPRKEKINAKSTEGEIPQGGRERGERAEDAPL
jgi:hypothetical protein